MKRLFAQWRDLEAGTKGVHWLRWSPGLRDLVGLDVEELTDEEIANTDEIEAEEVAVVSWDQIREHVEELRRVLREVDEDKSWETLLMCLDSLGVDYYLEAVDVWRSRVVARMAALRVGDR